MIHNKKEFGLGLVLFIGFWALFAVFMSPVFAGHNLLDYMDNLYNSISKQSAYYIPGARENAEEYIGRETSFTVDTRNRDQAERTAANFAMVGAEVSVDGTSVRVTGDVGEMLTFILDDADYMYDNEGDVIAEKYGQHERLVMYDWWNALDAGHDDLNLQEKFDEARVFHQVLTRAVEPAYNYYEIEAQPIRDNALIVVISLVGYVVYTLWFGFSILFMFEGWGIRLEH